MFLMFIPLSQILKQYFLSNTRFQNNAKKTLGNSWHLVSFSSVCVCLGRTTSKSEYPNCPVFELETPLHNLINWSTHRECQSPLRLDCFICLLSEKFTACIFRWANSTNPRKVTKSKNKQKIFISEKSLRLGILFFFFNRSYVIVKDYLVVHKIWACKKGKKVKSTYKINYCYEKRETKALFSNNMSPPSREYLTLSPCLCLKLWKWN